MNYLSWLCGNSHSIFFCYVNYQEEDMKALSVNIFVFKMQKFLTFPPSLEVKGEILEHFQELYSKFLGLRLFSTFGLIIS